ncbi:hypothetical protein V9T40_009720 [Parthenolecanium corni]|uniref:Uncharacterized protein n=1 Tax=Parthenolecanium corni TaxID=536013 RepID=A0AAN9TZR4_9HEMI
MQANTSGVKVRLTDPVLPVFNWERHPSSGSLIGRHVFNASPCSPPPVIRTTHHTPKSHFHTDGSGYVTPQCAPWIRHNFRHTLADIRTDRSRTTISC